MSRVGIIGFGASCMSGFGGIEKEKTFFWKFAENLNRRDSELLSLGGYPVTRVEKYAQRIVRKKPVVVILQFGSTDVGMNLKQKISGKKPIKIDLSNWRQAEGKIGKANTYALLLWRVKSILCRILKVQPRTKQKEYIYQIEHFAKMFLKNSIYPIILSPFPRGDNYINNFSKKYAEKLEENLKKYDLIYINTHTFFNQYNKRDILLEDGLHLTEFGHDLIYKELCKYKVEVLEKINQSYCLDKELMQ